MAVVMMSKRREEQQQQNAEHIRRGLAGGRSVEQAAAAQLCEMQLHRATAREKLDSVTDWRRARCRVEILENIRLQFSWVQNHSISAEARLFLETDACLSRRRTRVRVVRCKVRNVAWGKQSFSA